MLIFVLVFIGISAALEFYTFRGLKDYWDNWKPWMRKLSGVLFFTLLGLSAFSVIMMLTSSRLFDRFILNFWFSFVMVNLIVKLTFAIFLFVDDIRRLSLFAANSIQSKPKEEIPRSEFLLKSGMIAATAPFLGLSWGMIAGPYRYRVRTEKIQLPHLPPAFEGLKIVQISDIHAGSFYNSLAVERGIDLILTQNADVIFFTGDLVNDRADEMLPYIELFSRIKAPLGVYSIMGNHDYGEYTQWRSEKEKATNDHLLKEIHKKLGWNLLLNEHVYLQKGADKIAVLGVENWGQNFIQKGDLEKAYNNCIAPVKLLLSHDPTHFDQMVTKKYPDIDITFSGHTHGAQMGIETGGFKWSPVSLRYSKWAGLYEENGQYLYINRGFGFIGYAGRLGIMPEITVMTLHA